MERTGIIRRVDDLGRVAIPKDVRRRYKIQEGEALEFFLTDEGILLKKYREENKEEFAKNWLMTNNHYIDFHQSRFTIEGTTVTCEVIVDGQREYGAATCNPRDISVGMVIALCRATNTPIPEELLD